MCARFSLTSPIDAMRQLFNFTEYPNFAPSYNVAPSVQVPAIRQQELGAEGQRQLFFAHWGLIPSWSKDISQSAKLINARSETITEKPSFRRAFATQRCLIPCNGFYEWQKREDGSKQPYLFYSEEAPLFAFAGLWEGWQAPDQTTMLSCTILTMQATSPISEIHHRMPVTVRPDYFNRWLAGTTKESLPQPADQISFNCHPVHKKVGNVRNDEADLIKKIDLSKVPEQGRLF